MDNKWDALNDRIKNNNSSFKEPKLPFCKNNLIRDFNQLYFKVYDKVKAVEL